LCTGHLSEKERKKAESKKRKAEAKAKAKKEKDGKQFLWLLRPSFHTDPAFTQGSLVSGHFTVGMIL
jgi:hypothetical protein